MDFKSERSIPVVIGDSDLGPELPALNMRNYVVVRDDYVFPDVSVHRVIAFPSDIKQGRYLSKPSNSGLAATKVQLTN